MCRRVEGVHSEFFRLSNIAGSRARRANACARPDIVRLRAARAARCAPWRLQRPAGYVRTGRARSANRSAGAEETNSARRTARLGPSSPMHHFAYRAGVMHAEAVDLGPLAASVGTPFYCYSTATLGRHYRVFAEAFADVPSLV